MKIFDFNIHLPAVESTDVNQVIADDLSLDEKGLCSGLRKHYSAVKKISGANFLLFNQQLFNQPVDSFKSLCAKQFGVRHWRMTALLDFRQKNLEVYFGKLKEAGVFAIMFNSYLQKIAEADFQQVLKACQLAEKNKMTICIDGSYGTSKMYAYDNMKLACLIADAITKIPIVIIHSGGYRILEAMLLALDKPNIYLDTSFSLNYYVGSSLEKDYAFAYKKIGANRVMFGSDHPYDSFSEAFKKQLSFFKSHHFSDTEVESIFYKTAMTLIHG